MLTFIVTITRRYICSANSDCDDKGLVYRQCKQLL